ncbi:nitrate transporter [Acinetobacter gyllenbergii]|uniref:NitT/TauT family transport system ATP-binding protein n=1 Tax=Acinetobacter gyllenbergii CIP 110306 = MTCC 11365 TaxID=1217657 RepID=A0A829HL28_9GAMM|nr:ABC transporter substrate-binding protein [Acinetobacter gyllenbergii]EPF87907.1 NitT/TauT family transport system ATP-binding protein [Acinetobacter gyllenbergii CIP 110306 = MTCC 11365]EPH36018.1 Nitrate ABC transporter, nitrate-binding protein [Acinetobacter gyllenbergii CIP 110306 = MTCC 11365]GMA12589.1 nitrate transporter [Acinetobacter gyllenbergii]
MSHLVELKKVEKTELQLGYIPLLDCVALLWAKQRGFFEEVGLNVNLVKEASWASLRDRLAFGLLDAAHCLSAMLPAAAVGTDQIGIPLQTPLVLSENRAFISLSQKLCYALDIQKQDSAESSAKKLTDYIHQHQNVSLAHVFQHSIHHYCLREWLALADPKLAQSIQMKTLPPPYMVEAISNHLIDGFCVGEPWNTQAELQGLSHLVCSSQHIIPNVADKVLAVTQEWAQQHPDTLIALTSAIMKAQHELRLLDDFSPVWQLLIEFDMIQFDCSPEVHVEKYFTIQNIIRNFVQASAEPKAQDFEWLFQQMQKWNGFALDETTYRDQAQNCLLAETFQAASLLS